VYKGECTADPLTARGSRKSHSLCGYIPTNLFICELWYL